MPKSIRAAEAIKANPQKYLLKNLALQQRAREEVEHDVPPAREGRDGKSYSIRKLIIYESDTLRDYAAFLHSGIGRRATHQNVTFSDCLSMILGSPPVRVGG